MLSTTGNRRREREGDENESVKGKRFDGNHMRRETDLVVEGPELSF